MTQLDPIVNGPYLNFNGLAVSYATSTTLSVAAGQCRDSNNIVDMILGDYLNEGTGTANSATILNAAVNGLNGLDTGSLAASSMYSLYMISDSSNKLPTGVTLSLNVSTPALPFGYDSYRKIGYWPTSSGSVFILGYYGVSGNGSKVFFYDAPQATAITAGHATSYTAVNLSGLVPLVNNIPVWIYSNYIPATAGNALNLQPGNGTGAAITITGQVATVHVTTNSLLISQNTTISSVLSPTINYQESNSSDAVAIDVAGFEINL